MAERTSMSRRLTFFVLLLLLWGRPGGAGEDRIESALQRLGTSESPEASQQLRELVLLYESQGDSVMQARALSALGKALHWTGDLGGALEALQKAIALQKVSDNLNLATSLGRIGEVHFDLGQLDLAGASFEQELALLQSTGQAARTARALRHLSLVYSARGRFDQALLKLDQALVLQRAAGDLRGEGETLADLGRIHLALGQYEVAVQTLHQALGIWQRLKNPAGEAETLQRLGYAYHAMGQLDDADQVFMRSIVIGRKIQSRSGIADSLEGMAVIQMTRSRPQEALELVSEALMLRREMRQRGGEAKALLLLGNVKVALGEVGQALERSNQALSIYREIGDLTGIIRALELSGGVYEAKGSPQEALQRYQEAITLHDQRRSETVLQEVRAGLESQASLLFERTVRLLLRLGQATSAFEMSERSRARTLLESWGAPGRPADEEANDRIRSVRNQLDSLNRQLREEVSKPNQTRDTARIELLNSELSTRQAEYESLVTRSRPVPDLPEIFQPRSLPEIQKNLPPDTTLLSYYTTVDRLVAFVIGRDSFRAIEIDLRTEEIAGKVEVFRDFSSLEASDLTELQYLYNVLIRPLLPSLRPGRIGVVPHGTLSYLPFAALTDGETFLGESYSLFYLPSASFYELVTSRKPAEKVAVVAMAASRVSGLQSLPSADREARFIASLFDSSQLLTGDQATEGALRRQVRQASILHIAAHAELNPVNPGFSRLLLRPDKDNDGALEVREIGQLHLSQTDLVVLSASMTSISTLGSGDDINGFSHAFLAAGVPSVVASLWRVDDRGTAYFMETFYQKLRIGQAKAEALRAAQSEMRRKPGFSHPYYWAAFILSGNPD